MSEPNRPIQSMAPGELATEMRIAFGAYRGLGKDLIIRAVALLREFQNALDAAEKRGEVALDARDIRS